MKVRYLSAFFVILAFSVQISGCDYGVLITARIVDESGRGHRNCSLTSVDGNVYIDGTARGSRISSLVVIPNDKEIDSIPLKIECETAMTPIYFDARTLKDRNLGNISVPRASEKIN